MKNLVSIPGQEISYLSVSSLRKADVNPFRAEGSPFRNDLDLPVSGSLPRPPRKKQRLMLFPENRRDLNPVDTENAGGGIEKITEEFRKVCQENQSRRGLVKPPDRPDRPVTRSSPWTCPDKIADHGSSPGISPGDQDSSGLVQGQEQRRRGNKRLAVEKERGQNHTFLPRAGGGNGSIENDRPGFKSETAGSNPFKDLAARGQPRLR